MNQGLVTSLTFNAIACLVAFLAWRTIRGLLMDNVRLQRILAEKEQKLMAEQILRMTAPPKQAVPAFDAQTRQLLALAVKNTNENESRAAAVQACKRIHKKLNP